MDFNKSMWKTINDTLHSKLLIGTLNYTNVITELS